MKCKDPILCYSDGQKRMFRHFSLSSPVFRSMSTSVFRCGKCIQCRKARSVELAMRCVLHASLYENNCFLTLTHDEKDPRYHNGFDYKEIQDFKKRLRRHVEFKYNKKIQVFNVHEYGKNGKKHWHLVVFNHDFSDKEYLYDTPAGHKLYTSAKLRALWDRGHNTVGDVTEASAMYQAQYTQKDFKYGHVLSAKQSHSKHSAIGREYFLRHYKQILSLGFIPFNGRKMPVPRYFEKLAHRHYCHFYDRSAFLDTSERRRLYSRLCGNAKIEIADLFMKYYSNKKKKVEELREEWDSYLEQFIFSGEKPDFLKSAENMEYDLKNRVNRNQL